MSTEESSQQSPAGELNAEWSTRLAAVLQAMAGESPSAECVAAAVLPENVEMLWWEQRLNRPGGPTVWIGAGEQSWQGLGARTAAPGAVPQGGAEDVRNRYLEMLAQSFIGLAKEPGKIVPAPRETVRASAVVLKFASGETVQLLVAHSAEQADEPAPAPRPAGALDLLLEIELPVSISFGRTRLPFQEVLKLTTGSIIELNRSAEDPVEVVVNDRVIARGEVVLVNGNYGVRIQQLASRSERLQSANVRFVHA